jgi:hypothetical protein
LYSFSKAYEKMGKKPNLRIKTNPKEVLSYSYTLTKACITHVTPVYVPFLYRDGSNTGHIRLKDAFTRLLLYCNRRAKRQVI